MDNCIKLMFFSLGCLDAARKESQIAFRVSSYINHQLGLGREA